MITSEQFAAIFPNCPAPVARAAAVSAAFKEFGFDDVDAQCGYFGITGNETGGYMRNKSRENMMYSPNAAYRAFGPMRAAKCVSLCPLDNEGHTIRHDHGEAFANCIYANMIGNGDYASGDGWRYRGGFDVQLTGEGNYIGVGALMGVKLVDADIDALASDPDMNARVAACFIGPYAGLLPLLATGAQDDFLTAANKVGHPPPGATDVRLGFWNKARTVLGAANADGGKPPRRTPLPPTIAVGDISYNTVVLQRMLNDTYNPPSRLDVHGVFDNATRDVVAAYQRANGLADDGVVGPATWGKLLEV